MAKDQSNYYYCNFCLGKPNFVNENTIFYINKFVHGSEYRLTFSEIARVAFLSVRANSPDVFYDIVYFHKIEKLNPEQAVKLLHQLVNLQVFK